MSKLEERESRRRSITVGKFVEQPPVEAVSSGRRGRPKENRELKKRISLSVLPSVYEGIQKIAYVDRKSVCELIEEMMEDYQKRNQDKLEEYGRLQEWNDKGLILKKEMQLNGNIDQKNK